MTIPQGYKERSYVVKVLFKRLSRNLIRMCVKFFKVLSTGTEEKCKYYGYDIYDLFHHSLY